MGRLEPEGPPSVDQLPTAGVAALKPTRDGDAVRGKGRDAAS